MFANKCDNLCCAFNLSSIYARRLALLQVGLQKDKWRPQLRK